MSHQCCLWCGIKPRQWLGKGQTAQRSCLHQSHWAAGSGKAKMKNLRLCLGFHINNFNMLQQRVRQEKVSLQIVHQCSEVRSGILVYTRWKSDTTFCILESGNISWTRPVRESAVASGRFSSAIISHIFTSAAVSHHFKLSSACFSLCMKTALTFPDIDACSAMFLWNCDLMCFRQP